MNLAAIASEPEPRSRPAPTGDTPLVELVGVWRSWGRGKTRREVLRDVDLEIAPGTATSVSGRNGVGKTTLLRIITGILAPDSGIVMVDGIRPTDSWRDYHRRVGFLSAGDRGLYARVTVQGRLEHWTALALVPRRERKQRVAEALAVFELTGLAKRRADRLSQGQRQVSGLPWRSCTGQTCCSSTSRATASIPRDKRCWRTRCATSCAAVEQRCAARRRARISSKLTTGVRS